MSRDGRTFRTYPKGLDMSVEAAEKSLCATVRA
jgi:hypothetical protein